MLARPTPTVGRRLVLVSAIGLPWLAACGSKPKPGAPPPTSQGLFKPDIATMGGEIVAAADLNPSASNRPSPLPLRVFELRSAVAFNKADFLPLYQDEVQALGPELVVREEFVVSPGEKKVLQKTLNAETKFIGVFGAYRSFERAVWRAVAPVQPGKKHQVLIRADAQGLAIELKPI